MNTFGRRHHDIARHVTRCRFTLHTGVYHAVNDAASVHFASRLSTPNSPPASHSRVANTASSRSSAFGRVDFLAPESMTPPRSFSMNRHGSRLALAHTTRLPGPSHSCTCCLNSFTGRILEALAQVAAYHITLLAPGSTFRGTRPNDNLILAASSRCYVKMTCVGSGKTRLAFNVEQRRG